MTDKRRDIIEMTPDALAAWLGELGEPPYRARQIMEWVYARRATSFEEMTNLSRPLRRELARAFSLEGLREVSRQRARDRATEKYLLEMADGERIESVWMSDRKHGTHTFCISTQAGCALRCRFCATGAVGLARNLTTAEITGQVLALARAKGWPANVVFMGMGEPLLNLEAVLPALEALCDDARFNLGSRRITISTAGITPGIAALGEHKVHPNLALSLNSPFEDQRSELMPINRRYPLSEVLDACEHYAERARRRILIEYVLIGGVNTSLPAARGVVRIARRLRAMVNLIPFNPVPECRLVPPSGEEASKFRGVLEREGITVAQRYRRGRDISAACGQLRGAHAAAAPKDAETEDNTP